MVSGRGAVVMPTIHGLRAPDAAMIRKWRDRLITRQGSIGSGAPFAKTGLQMTDSRLHGFRKSDRVRRVADGAAMRTLFL